MSNLPQMDALKGIGHACGHNLIAISGVAVACALKAAFEKHQIDAEVHLLGTPGKSFEPIVLPKNAKPAHNPAYS